jgi:hypothetical protein
MSYKFLREMHIALLLISGLIALVNNLIQEYNPYYSQKMKNKTAITISTVMFIALVESVGCPDGREGAASR